MQCAARRLIIELALFLLTCVLSLLRDRGILVSADYLIINPNPCLFMIHGSVMNLSLNLFRLMQWSRCWGQVELFTVMVFPENVQL